MSALLDVILPVFLVIGFGYAAARWLAFGDSAVDGLMRFAQSFAIPCLLFKSIATLDLGANAELPLFLAFYIGAFTCFALGFLAARIFFRRPIEDSVAIGFVCLFSNSLLLGVPITERAYGPAALAGNFSIIALHSPIFYIFGIIVMELARSRGRLSAPLVLIRQILRGVFTQPLVLGVLSGLAFNFSGLPIPAAMAGFLDLITRAAVPAALFGLGGVLLRYRPEGDMKAIALCCGLSIVVHPALTYGLGHALALDRDQMRSAVMTAAMAPGVNAYLFAHNYGVGKRIAASSVLIGTAASILTIWIWLHILP